MSKEKHAKPIFPEPSPTTFRRCVMFFFYAALLGIGLFLFFRYLAIPLLPFGIALLIAASLQKPLIKLQNRLHLPRLFFAILFVVLLFAAIVFLFYQIAASLFGFFGNLVKDNATAIVDAFSFVQNTIHELLARLPVFSAGTTEGFLSKLLAQADSLGESAIRSMLDSLSAKLPELFADLAGALPRIAFFLVVTVIASVWATADYPKIIAVLRRGLHGKYLRGARLLKGHALGTLRHYLRAYGLILALTFAQLWIGFSILGIENAAAPAALTSLVDILPILGTGTVLIPWALLQFATGNIRLGIGLCLLYAVITIVREIAEPRIVGKSIGLYPPLTLLAMYVGMRLFGLVGLFLFPFCLQLCMRIWREHAGAAQTTQAAKKGV